MVELPADIRQALARSRAQSEPSAEDQARVASALALRLGVPDADWATPPPSAAKVAVAHTSWAVKLLAGAGVVGLATTLLVALPALRKAGDGTRAVPLTAASASRAEAPRGTEAIAPPPSNAAANRAGVDRVPDTSELRRRTTRSLWQAHDTRPAQVSTSQTAAAREPRSQTATGESDDRSPSDATATSARAAVMRSSQMRAANEGAQLAGADTPRSNTAATPPPSAAGAAKLTRPVTPRSNTAATPPPSAADGAKLTRAGTAHAAAAVPPPSAAEASSHATLARELALVRGASHALDRDEPQAALQLLNQHAREFADGALNGEREALRLSTLCRLGREAEARELHAKLATELAHSPLRARIEHDCARELSFRH